MQSDTAPTTPSEGRHGPGVRVARTGPPVPTSPAPHLVVRGWWDPEIARRGHDPRSTYAERFWLPLVGPSTLLLLRRFARGLELRPSGFRVSLPETALSLGLGAGTGRQAALSRTIDRACTFGLARRSGPDALLVRTHLPPLTRRQASRLPEVLRRAHEQERRTTPTAVRGRERSLRPPAA
jgi:hypothetical protein